jgi:group I intron endonuclease
MKNKISCIYKLINLQSNNIYVGQTIDYVGRRYAHYNSLKKNKHSNEHLQNAYNKYGKENFVFEILLYCEPFELTRYEQFFVDTLHPEYNICRECVNSSKGVKQSEQTKKKKSIKLKGRVCSEETKKKLSEAKKGIPRPEYVIKKMHFFKKGNIAPKSIYTDAWRKSISESLLGLSRSIESRQKQSVSVTGNKNHFFGKTHTEETKQRISAAHKNKKLSEAHKLKIQEIKTDRRINKAVDEYSVFILNYFRG